LILRKDIRSILFFCTYLLCVVFSLGAAVNEGFTRWYTGIPFFILFFVITKKFNKSKRFSLLAFAIIFSSIYSNSILPKNSFLYPILNEGYLIVQEDGYIHQYSDNSAGFYKDEKEIKCTGCGEVKKHSVKSGERIKVEGISYSYPDLGFRRAYKTAYGNIVPETHFKLSHEAHPLLKLGELMYYPALPIILITSLTTIGKN